VAKEELDGAWREAAFGAQVPMPSMNPNSYQRPLLLVS